MNLGKVLKVGTTVLAAAGTTVGVTEAVSTVVETHTINQVHEIVYNDVYLVDGIEVSFSDYYAILNDMTEENEIREVVITKDDFDTDGIARLSNLLDFEFDTFGKVCAVKIRSDKVKSVSYNYAEKYINNTDGNNFYVSGDGLVYQDVESQINGLVFIIGQPVNNSYEVVYDLNTEVGTYIYYFINDGRFEDLKFEDVFKSITLKVEY